MTNKLTKIVTITPCGTDVETGSENRIPLWPFHANKIWRILGIRAAKAIACTVLKDRPRAAVVKLMAL